MQARDVITFWNTGTSHLLQVHKFNHSSSHYGHCVGGNRSDLPWPLNFHRCLLSFFFFYSFSLLCRVLLIMLNICVHLEDFLSVLLIMVQCLQLWTNYVQTYGKTITLTTHPDTMVTVWMGIDQTLIPRPLNFHTCLLSLFFFPVFHYCGVLLIMLNTCVHLEDFLLLLLILVQCLQLCTWLLL